MSLVVTLGTIGAGAGLSAGLAFNLRLVRAIGAPLGAALVNFLVGGTLLLALWGLGGARTSTLPPPWMLAGGIYGATYVTLNLASAARVGPGVSTVTVTLGQVLGALLIAGGGWLGQAARRPGVESLVSAALLLGAVTLLARDRSSDRSSDRASDRTDDRASERSTGAR
jgi:transporter family-2 protein